MEPTRSQSDKELLKGVTLRFWSPAGQGLGLIGNIAGSVSGTVEFQFPPRVTSDGKRHSWQEKELNLDEPLAIAGSSSPRDITLSFTYICDGIDGWGPTKIQNNLRLIRGYFTRFVQSENRNQAMLVYLRIWGIGGNSLGKFRAKSCDMKYSETLIIPKSGAKSAFPYRTDVTIDLSSWFRFSQSENETDLSDVEVVQDDESQGGINDELLTPEDWY